MSVLAPIDATTARLRFRMPAEWEPHVATWISWPHYSRDWEGKMAAVHWDYVEIVRQLVRGEEVRILVQTRTLEARARRMLVNGGVDVNRVTFHIVQTDRSWLRDTGPTVVAATRPGDRSSRRFLLDWGFNGWGRYPRWRRDDRVPGRVAAIRKLPRVEPHLEVGGRRRRVVLEGGSIDVNGRGLLLTTEGCLLGQRHPRNPGFSREDMERVFRQYLGIRKTLWLGRGIMGDDTEGHVDDLARFVGPRKVVAAQENDRHDLNYEPLRDNLSRLRRMTDTSGRRLSVVTLPMPRPLFFCGDRLPASYLNFYVANQMVLMPTFNDPADRIALNTLQRLFGDREVIGIHALNLVVGQGTLHCLTQQEPR